MENEIDSILATEEERIKADIELLNEMGYGKKNWLIKYIYYFNKQI